MAGNQRVELLYGTLDLIVLRALVTIGPLHAYALASRLEQVAEHPLMLNQGTLYPALVRLEQRGWIKGTWRRTENNREATYYACTAAGRRAAGGRAGPPSSPGPRDGVVGRPFATSCFSTRVRSRRCAVLSNAC